MIDPLVSNSHILARQYEEQDGIQDPYTIPEFISLFWFRNEIA